jgi:polyisoprenoid-binding protein YceI
MASRLPSFIGAALLAAILTADAATPAAPAPPAGVTDYTLDPARSSLKFQFTQAGAASQGRFRKFAAKLRFGDTNLAASRLEVTIDVNSLDTGDEERDKVLRGPELFDVTAFPRASYQVSKITRVSAGRYEAHGKLTIRDVTRNVTVPFGFRPANEKGAAAGYMIGRVTIKRLDFGVGQGEWKATDQVANEVDVNFSLRFTPAAAAPAAK